MNMNGYYPNHGASTSSIPYPNQLSMNPSNPLFVGEMSMRDSPLPRPPGSQHMQQQNTWNPQLQPSQQQMNQSQTQPHQQQWSFPNGMGPNMASFNMPFLPPHVIQDAIALSTPVDSADEPLLVKHILEGLKRGSNYKMILNGMHGKNDHSASLWKDYYLEHKPRIDAWISMCLQQSPSTSPTEQPRPHPIHAQVPISGAARHPSASVRAATIKKPAPSSFKTENVVNHPPTPSFLPKRNMSASVERTTIPQAQILAQATGRSTINSLTVGTPVFDRRLPPPHAEIKVPEAPSRSPSPPTIIVPKARGNKYTDEDHAFFIKFIQWKLTNNPSLTRTELCEMLGTKAAHHTAQSWASYWSMHHDLPDKIMAACRGEAEEGSASDEEVQKPLPRKRPRYRDSTTSEEDESSEEESPKPSRSNKRKVVVKEEDGQDAGPIRVWKESEMGPKGAPFTEADMYITAKYICDFPNWPSAMSKDRWTPFTEKYPQRSAKAWGEYYRRYETEIDRLVRRMQKEKERR